MIENCGYTHRDEPPAILETLDHLKVVCSDSWHALASRSGPDRTTRLAGMNETELANVERCDENELQDARRAAKAAGYGSGSLAAVIENLVTLCASAKENADRKAGLDRGQQDELDGLIPLNTAQLDEIEDWATMSNSRWADATARRINLTTFARSILRAAKAAREGQAPQGKNS